MFNIGYVIKDPDRFVVSGTHMCTTMFNMKVAHLISTIEEPTRNLFVVLLEQENGFTRRRAARTISRKKFC